MRGNRDVVVVGAGPNGLAAAIELAREGWCVRVLEAKSTAGGGMRSSELTDPGFIHDVCSACHPMGLLSPWFRRAGLEDHGLRWIRPPASVAHPLKDGDSVLLYRELGRTAEQLGQDGRAYARMIEPFLREPHALLEDLMGPLQIPSHPLRMARFGLPGLLPATTLFGRRFREPQARALMAGCAAHSILPLESPLTAAVATIFALTGHLEEWPVAAGGSESIARAMVSCLESLGGTVETGVQVGALSELPPEATVIFDTSPAQLATICEQDLPPSYLRRLRRYRYGPGVFKLDWALSDPIPWQDPRTLEASTVHLGGTMEEIAAAEAAVWRGEHPERPFVMIVQQSQFDPSRAPEGRHTGYAYCHVPEGSTVDCTDLIELRIEEFAPGFRETILARHAMNTAAFEAHNPNYLGGAITGGVADLGQFFTRPVARLDPYSTPNPRVFLCSASTPPGGGVHGMCGYHAAQSVLRRSRR